MRYIYWIAAVLMTGTYLCGPIHDVDLWWHIVAGRWIQTMGTVPLVDYWNAFGEGKPWIAYSWSFEMLVATVELHFGAVGLYATKIVLALLLVAILAVVYSRLASDWTFGLLLGLYAATACHNHFTLRPQSLIWVLFALSVLLAETIRNNGLSTSSRLGILCLMSLWANTHLTQALGLMTIFLWIFDTDSWQLAVEATIYAFLGTLLTPYGGTEWIVFFTKSGHPAMYSAIAEFKPATLLQYPSVFLLLLSIICLYFIHCRPRALRFGQYAMTAIFVLGGLAVLKFLPFAIISVACLLACLWTVPNRTDAYGNLAEALERLCAFLQRAPREGAAFVMLVLAYLNVQHVWSEPISPNRTPVNAVSFMQQQSLPTPVLNDFGRGGYLAYRYANVTGIADIRVAIDGRTNVNPPEVWDASFAALMGQHNWHEYFAMVQPETVLWRTESALTPILLNGDAWCRVYQTGSEAEGYSVFVKKDYLLNHADTLDSDNCKIIASDADTRL